MTNKKLLQKAHMENLQDASSDSQM